MARNGIEWDLREFRNALVQYEVASKKDGAEVANAKLKDLMFRAASQTPKAKAADIQALRAKSWWKKYVNKAVHAKHGKLNKKAFKRAWKEMDRKIIRARKRSVSYLRGGFILAGNKILASNEMRPGKQKPRRTKKWQAIDVQTRTARPKARGSYAEARIDYAAGNGRDAVIKESILGEAIGKSVAIVTKDMKKYLDRKMRERAKQYSGIIR